MSVNEMNQNKLKTHSALWGRFYTIAEVADLLEVSSRTVRRWINAGLLKVHRFGRSVRIAEADLHAFLAVHRAL
jgi:excisionase family DNA binding protein